MTIAELYKNAKSNGKENYEIFLQYQDGEGGYFETGKLEDIEVNDDMEEVTLS